MFIRAVVEGVYDVDDGGERTDVAPPVLVLEQDAEDPFFGDALTDQLSIARLEDVERDTLGRDEDEAEWEEADLRHGESVVGRGPG